MVCRRNNHNIGRKLKKAKCKNCGKVFKTKSPHIYCSKECMAIFGNRNSKERYIRHRKKRKLGVCYICGTKKNLETHHIIQKINNGKETVTLCKRHHRIIHKFYWMLENLGYKIIKVKK